MQRISKESIKLNKDFMEIDLDSIKIVFSTAEENRSFNRNTEEGLNNIRTIVDEYVLKDIMYLKQVHSNKVYEYINGYDDVKNEEGDAILTSIDNLAVGVFTADCVPVIIVNEEKKVVAAIHSGWKGTFDSIVSVVLDFMSEKYSVNHKSTKVYIGPHIRQCCYEVSEELKEKFIDKTKIEEGVLFNGRNLSMEICIVNDLVEKGISENNIYTMEMCTHCEEETRLFSYRVSKGSYGRLLSFVFIK